MRIQVADATEIGGYKNGHEHLWITACKIGDDEFSDATSHTGFFYDRRRRKLYTDSAWHHTTPCREWDPGRTSTYCSMHPKA